MTIMLLNVLSMLPTDDAMDRNSSKKIDRVPPSLTTVCESIRRRLNGTRLADESAVSGLSPVSAYLFDARREYVAFSEIPPGKMASLKGCL